MIIIVTLFIWKFSIPNFFASRESTLPPKTATDVSTYAEFPRVWDKNQNKNLLTMQHIVSKTLEKKVLPNRREALFKILRYLINYLGHFAMELQRNQNLSIQFLYCLWSFQKDAFCEEIRPPMLFLGCHPRPTASQMWPYSLP